MHDDAASSGGSTHQFFYFTTASSSSFFFFLISLFLISKMSFSMVVSVGATVGHAIKRGKK
jgi:hypothetical protein